MKKSLLLLSSMLLAASAFAAEAADPVTITVSTNTGTLGSYSNHASLYSNWTSTATDPGVLLTVHHNNAAKGDANNGERNSDGDLQVYTGGNGVLIKLASTTEGWHVSGYSFTATLPSGQDKVVTAQGGESQTLTSTSPVEVNVNNIANNTEASFSITGANSEAIHLTNFKVTLSPYVAESEPEGYITLNPQNGTLYRDGSASSVVWCGKLQLNEGDVIVSLSTGANNMSTNTAANANNANDGKLTQGDILLATGNSGSCTYSLNSEIEGWRVCGFSFDSEMNTDGSSSIAAHGTTVATPGHVYVNDIDENTNASFTLSGDNSHHTIIKNLHIYVTPCATFPARTYIFSGNSSIWYRIPAIAIVGEGAHKGRLIAVNDERINNGSDLGDNVISLHLATSDDNGKTWTAPAYGKGKDGSDVTKRNESKTISGNGDENWDVAWGDAAIVGDRESQKVLMVACAGNKNFFASRFADGQRNQVVKWVSEDGGDTWSPATRMTDEIYALWANEPVMGQIDGMFIGSGRMMQSRYVKVGDYYRVYAVASTQNNGGNTRNWVLYTDDMGETWAILGGIDQCPVPSNADEPKAEELPDGSVLLAARANGGNRNFNIFRYTDPEKGQGRWDTYINTGMGYGPINACDGEIYILPVRNKATQQQCYIALQSFPYDPVGKQRKNVSIAWKALTEATDINVPSAFSTWDGRYQVIRGNSLYTTMILTADNQIGFLFEEENSKVQPRGYAGAYVNISIETITGGEYEYCEDADNAVANALRDKLVDYRDIHFVTAEDEYIGTIINHESNFDAALSNYNAAPSAETYYRLNAAEYTGEKHVIKSGSIYRFIFANKGNVYSSLSEDYYLAADKTNATLISTNDINHEGAEFKVTATENGNYIVKNIASGLHLGQAPTANETAFALATSSDDAVEYRISSDINGHTNLTCTTGEANRGSIHFNSGKNIVRWTADAPASQWYMEFVKDDPESAIEEVTTPIDAAAPSHLFDLQGRPVATPSKGQIYISSDRRKIIF